MKTVKYYYSKIIRICYIPCLTDDHGDVLRLSEVNSAKSKKLPRVTVASVYDKDNNSMSFGIAVCSPKDNFKKSEGRKIAYDRALNSPKIVVTGIRKGKVRDASKRYATALISAEEKNFLNGMSGLYE